MEQRMKNKQVLKTITWLIIMAGIGVMPNCKKDPGALLTEANLGYQYYPAVEGSMYTYQVDSIVLDDFNNDTLYYSYQIRERFESVLSEENNDTTYRVERLIKWSDTTGWQIKDVWQIRQSNLRIEVVEENTPYTKMVFPISIGKTWDGNARNSKSEQEYEYETVESDTVLGTTTEDVVQVTQIDESNLLFLHSGWERFAPNVGMVKKEFIKINLEKDSGLIYRMQLIDYEN